MDNIKKLKEKIFETLNTDCFIERERFLSSFAEENDIEGIHCAEIFAKLLDYVSLPVSEDDIFVGRVVEGALDIVSPSEVLMSLGHITPDYGELITQGYVGILRKIKRNAASLNNAEAEKYARNAETVINAVRNFASRYSAAAEKAGNKRAAEALAKVPYEPAYDLYSALQAIWLVHMIASCYMGARDYAFGYMDEYLYPFYLEERARGALDADIRLLLSGFMIKTNEICGRGTHNYKPKPVPCQASKQYLMLGGEKPNRLTELFLEAATENCMAQPEITVALSESSDEKFKYAVYSAMSHLTDKLQVYNYDLLKKFLSDKCMPPEISSRPSFSACCTFDLSYRSVRDEYYIPTVKIFCETLFEREYGSFEEFKKHYSRNIISCVNKHIENVRCDKWMAENREKLYLLDSLLNPDCIKNCKYPPSGLKYICKNMFLMGIATLGDSLHVLDELVFSKKQISYAEFINCLKNNFSGYEALHQRILAMPKFGNDCESDKYTVEMAELLINAVNSASYAENEIPVPAFYSLARDCDSSADIPATPNGRLFGSPFSENQSPTYGADKKGITALLNSLAKLPFSKTAAGGLNLKFSSRVKPEILSALIETYFEKGGLHVGITVVNKEMLKDAMKNPEKYKSLTVRLYGFSEYFVSLPLWQQLAVIERTEY